MGRLFTPTIEDYKRVKEYWSKICKEGQIYPTNKLYLPNDADRDIQPSDYCYNKTNIASLDRGYPFHKKEYLCFMFVSIGEYKYIGFNKPVTCKTIWTDKNGKKTIVGEWVNGEYTKFPRQ
jgi:hypothetical protein